MEFLAAPDYLVARFLFERSLAFIYFIAFLVAFNQFVPLLGSQGLLPVPEFLKRVSYKQAPSLFHLYYSDSFARFVAAMGMAISLAVFFGAFDMSSIWLHALAWLTLFYLYLSFMNVGQTFYAFGWESMLVEAGFFAAFMGPAWVNPSYITLFVLRWMLFRVEFGAGMIKLRGDPCWKNLTCLFYHYETQPMPNPLSWFLHHSPGWVHKLGVLFSLFVQVVLPFGLFLPQPICAISAALIIFHQLMLIGSGNYSWLNWLSIVLGVTLFTDSQFAFLGMESGSAQPIPDMFNYVLIAFGALILVLSIKPLVNLLKRQQLMNFSFNPYHIVNTYGAFGSVTKKRYELIIEGSGDEEPTEHSEWREYEFKGKPGDPTAWPKPWAPYHLRLDWLMWFLPFSILVGPTGILRRSTEIWFLRFIDKLLCGDKAILKLLKKNPFPDSPPTYIRVGLYLYKFTGWRELRQGRLWRREFVDIYLPPLSRRQLAEFLSGY